MAVKLNSTQTMNNTNPSSQKRSNLSRKNLKLITPESLRARYPNYPFDFSRVEPPEASSMEIHASSETEHPVLSHEEGEVPPLDHESDGSDDTDFSLDRMFSKEELQGLVSIIEIGSAEDLNPGKETQIKDLMTKKTKPGNGSSDGIDTSVDLEFIKHTEDTLNEYLPVLLKNIELAKSKRNIRRLRPSSTSNQCPNSNIDSSKKSEEAVQVVHFPKEQSEKKTSLSFDLPKPDRSKGHVNKAWKKTLFYKPSRFLGSVCSDPELNQRTFDELKRKSKGNDGLINVTPFDLQKRLVKIDESSMTKSAKGFVKRKLSSRAGRFIKLLQPDIDSSRGLRPYTELKEFQGFFPRNYDELLFYYLKLANYNTSYNKEKFSKEGTDLRRKLINEASLKFWKSIQKDIKSAEAAYKASISALKKSVKIKHCRIL